MSLARGTYRIADEPIPSKLSRWVTNPVFPLLGGMMGGFVVGLVWFLVNGVGIGSATLRREVALAWLGAVVALGGALLLVRTFDDSSSAVAIKLSALALQLVKLVILYALQLTQTRSFALHRHFGGHVANGIPALVILLLVRIQVFGELPSFWVLVLQ